jgi:hypothetical protein
LERSSSNTINIDAYNELPLGSFVGQQFWQLRHVRPARLEEAKARHKAKKAAGKATKRVVANAKPKRAAAKKAAAPVVAAVETVAVEVIEQPVSAERHSDRGNGDTRSELNRGSA